MFQFEQTNEPGRGCQSEAVSKIFDLNHCFGEDFFLEEGFWKAHFSGFSFFGKFKTLHRPSLEFQTTQQTKEDDAALSENFSQRIVEMT